MQRAGAGVDGDRMRGAAVGGELLLERRDFLAEDELAGVETRQHGGVDLALDDWYCAFRSTKESCDAPCLCRVRSTRPRCASDCVAASRMRTTRRPALPSAIGVRPLSMHVDELAQLELSASVTSSCGAHMSPVR